MRITFWGVRGIAPVSGPAYVRYGGDTLRVSVEADEENLVLGVGELPRSSVIATEAVVLRPPSRVGTLVRACGRMLAYVVDYQHGDAARDERLARAIAGADLLIYGALFSTWEAGVVLKQQAGVKLLALAQYHPDRTDGDLDRLAQAAARAAPNVFFAHQGLSLTL